MAQSGTTTPNLGLNQYSPTENLTWERFTQDNSLIDTAVGTNKTNIANKVNVDSAVINKELRIRNNTSYPAYFRSQDDGTLQLSVFNGSTIKAYLTMNPIDGTVVLSGNDLVVTSMLRPDTDALRNLGAPGVRWNNIYAASGTVSTSDKKYKTNISPLDDRYTMLILEIPWSKYEYVNGTSGRSHAGAIAQDVKAAMDKVGLSDKDFAGWINSPLEDESGNPTGEYAQGLRYEQFIPIMGKLLQEQQKRIEELESKQK